MSDIYGRRQLLCVAWVLFSAFSAGCGLSKSMASLSCSRWRHLNSGQLEMDLLDQRLSPWDAIRKVDLLGNVLILCATTLMVFALQEAGAFAYTWNSPVIVLTLSIAGLSSVMFITWEVFLGIKRITKVEPILPLRLITHRVYMGTLVCTLFTGFTYLSLLIIIPERFQIVNAENALWSGIHLLPMLGATAFGSFLAGALSSKRNNTSITLIASLCLQLIGTGLLSTLSNVTTEIKAQYGYQVILGLGIGLSLGAATILVSLQARHVDLAVAQGAIAQARVFGGAVGIAICSIILNTKIEDQLAGAMDPDEIEALHRSPTNTSYLPQEQQQLVRRVYASAFTSDMILMIGVCAAGIICSLLTFERRPPPMPSAPGQTSKDEMASRGQSSETELDELVDVRPS
ncbi:hypothetical protein DL767_001026 [Monosporascus sp. MG133]|nr:hypothetical protein DL767_001026 [Monosporascus sp. MG133]